MSATLRGRIVRRRVGRSRLIEARYTVSLAVAIQVRDLLKYLIISNNHLLFQQHLDREGRWVNSRVVAGRGARGRGRGGRGRGRGGRRSSSTAGVDDEEDDEVFFDGDFVPSGDRRLVPQRCHVVIEELVEEDDEDRLLYQQAVLLYPIPPMAASVGDGVGGHRGFGDDQGEDLPMDIVEQLFSPWED